MSTIKWHRSAQKAGFSTATSNWLEHRGWYNFKVGGGQEFRLNLLMPWPKLNRVKFNKISKFRLVKCIKRRKTR